MRKLLTVLLSALMVLSLGICASADGYSVGVSATQNDNGDLVISVTGDDAEKLASTIYAGSANWNSQTKIGVTVGDNWTGAIANKPNSDPVITKEGGNLTVLKETLVKGGFVNGTNKLDLVVDNTVIASTNVELSGLNEAPTPNALSSMSVFPFGNIPSVGEEAIDPIVHASDENGTITQSRQGDDGEWIEGRFYAYWAKKVENQYAEDGYEYRTMKEYHYDEATDSGYWTYEKFEEGQDYYLVINTSYIENMTGEKASTNVSAYSYDVFKVNVPKGATGGNGSFAYFSCIGSTEYAIKLKAAHKYSYSYDIENLEKINIGGMGMEPTEGHAFVFQFYAKDGYTVPKNAKDVTVTVGGVKFTDFYYEGTDFDDGNSIGHLMINPKDVTGDVTITTKCVKNEVPAEKTGNVPDTAYEGTQSDLNSKVDLTQEEKEKGAKVYLAVSDSVKAEDKKLVNDNLVGNTLGQILNITLVKEVNEEKTEVKETNAGLKISVSLDESLVNKDSSIERTYKVIRVHDNKTEILDASYDEATKKVTFTTDKFSTYAIVYKDTKKEEKKDDSNNNSSAKVVTCEEALNSKNWTWSESKKTCVYRVSKTSTK